MALAKFNGLVVLKFDDVTSGNFQALPSVTVRDPNTSLFVNIFSNDAGTPLSNPFNGTENGSFEFWVESGTYNIIVNEGSSDQTSLLNEDIGVRFNGVNEQQTLADGQTTVTFALSDMENAEILLSGENCDNGRLFINIDYTVTNTNTIELTDSQPGGTSIMAQL